MSGYAHFAGSQFADLGARLTAAKVGCEARGGAVNGIAVGRRNPFPAQRHPSHRVGPKMGGIAVGGSLLGKVLGNADDAQPFLTSGIVEKHFATLDGGIDPRTWFGYPDEPSAAWNLPPGAYDYFSYGFNQGAVQTVAVSAGIAALVAGGIALYKKFAKR